VIALLMLVELGLADPFTPPPPAAQRENQAGYELVRRREFAAARERFIHALAIAPELDAARWSLASSWAAEGAWDAALAELATLLAHNFPRFARQVTTDPDWAPIHLVPDAKSRLGQALELARARYTEGLGRSLVFIARFRAATKSKNGEQIRWFRHQEAFAYDRVARRVRQLTATDGRVLAFARAPSHRTIVYVVCDQERAGMLVGPTVRVLDLTSLGETPLDPGPVTTSLAFGYRGERPEAHGDWKGPPPARHDEWFQFVAAKGSPPLLGDGDYDDLENVRVRPGAIELLRLGKPAARIATPAGAGMRWIPNPASP
jgi:hypothetical protein